MIAPDSLRAFNRGLFLLEQKLESDSELPREEELVSTLIVSALVMLCTSEPLIKKKRYKAMSTVKKQ